VEGRTLVPAPHQSDDARIAVAVALRANRIGALHRHQLEALHRTTTAHPNFLNWPDQRFDTRHCSAVCRLTPIIEKGRTMPGIPQRSLTAAKINRDDFSAIPGEEKICVARIKLRYTEWGLTGAVCGFSEADRLLSTWKVGAGIPTECEFHVAFTDGKTINGRCQLWRGTRGRPSLSALI
jgi:hypothetical protein